MKRQFRHFSTVCHFNWAPLNRVDHHFFLNRLEPSVFQGYLSEALFYADLPQTGNAEKLAILRVQKSCSGIFAGSAVVSDSPEECNGIARRRSSASNRMPGPLGKQEKVSRTRISVHLHQKWMSSLSRYWHDEFQCTALSFGVAFPPDSPPVKLHHFFGEK